MCDVLRLGRQLQPVYTGDEAKRLVVLRVHNGRTRACEQTRPRTVPARRMVHDPGCLMAMRLHVYTVSAAEEPHQHAGTSPTCIMPLSIAHCEPSRRSRWTSHDRNRTGRSLIGTKAPSASYTAYPRARPCRFRQQDRCKRGPAPGTAANPPPFNAGQDACPPPGGPNPSLHAAGAVLISCRAPTFYRCLLPLFNSLQLHFETFIPCTTV
jgi:hypothetical protein